ncbi:MAG: gamma-glutamyl-gamma-aminobutyrate hydrolase family protein, partial [Bacteroidota bacterium]|nr:gamma-glutamyl-gamma-aminobutyrate hydrolase family protein [Bacteroidota bacterium]
MESIVVGICEGSKYPNYENWLKSETGVSIIKLSHSLDNLEEIEKCHGILLTGGSDIHPGLYNRPEFMFYIDKDEVDEERDEFEWEVLQHTEEFHKPVLGICRGLQMVNIFLGGTLIPDIPSFGKFHHGKTREGKDRSHTVTVDPNSQLAGILGVT